MMPANGSGLLWPLTPQQLIESLNNPRDIARHDAEMERRMADEPGQYFTPATWESPEEPTSLYTDLEHRVWHDLACRRQEAMRRLLGIPAPVRLPAPVDTWDPFKDEVSA